MSSVEVERPEVDCVVAEAACAEEEEVAVALLPAVHFPEAPGREEGAEEGEEARLGLEVVGLEIGQAADHTAQTAGRDLDYVAADRGPDLEIDPVAGVEFVVVAVACWGFGPGRHQVLETDYPFDFGLLLGLRHRKNLAPSCWPWSRDSFWGY